MYKNRNIKTERKKKNYFLSSLMHSLNIPKHVRPFPPRPILKQCEYTPGFRTE